MARKILTIPNLILRERSKKVINFDDELKKLVAEMLTIMQEQDGIGLAAPQLGVLQRIITLEYEPEEGSGEQAIPRTILINPTITKYSKEQVVMDEGCLSLPNLELKVRRPKEVNVAGYDAEGKKIKIRAKGLFARVLQHEIDHLDGKLFTDIALDKKDIRNYSNLKLAFLGTPEFAIPALEALAVRGLPIVGVITESDKPAGRKQEMTAPPVKQVAEEFGLPVFQPENKSELTEIIQQLEPHYLVVAAYGKILPAEVLEIPAYGAVNIHPSLLPKYRGPSPIQTAILDGEQKTGVTIMRMDEGMDTGAIISEQVIDINPGDTTESLSKKLAILGANLLIKTLPEYLSNQMQPYKQDEDQATYTKLIKKEDGLIDWKKPAEEIERMIRAYNPWPHAYAFIDGKRLIIHTAHVENNKLIPDIVQLEGKNPASWEDVKRGYKLELFS